MKPAVDPGLFREGLPLQHKMLSMRKQGRKKEKGKEWGKKERKDGRMDGGS